MDTPLFAEVEEKFRGVPVFYPPTSYVVGAGRRRTIRKIQRQVIAEALDSIRTPEGGWSVES